MTDSSSNNYPSSMYWLFSQVYHCSRSPECRVYSWLCLGLSESCPGSSWGTIGCLGDRILGIGGSWRLFGLRRWGISNACGLCSVSLLVIRMRRLSVPNFPARSTRSGLLRGHSLRNISPVSRLSKYIAVLSSNSKCSLGSTDQLFHSVKYLTPWVGSVYE